MTILEDLGHQLRGRERGREREKGREEEMGGEKERNGERMAKIPWALEDAV